MKSKNKLLSLNQIRKFHYRRQRKNFAETWYMDDWYNNPYSALKSRYYIETSALIVFILQYTKITPNFMTLTYAFLGALSGVFLASDNNKLILISLFLLFSKGSLDWGDGLLAILKKKKSILGDLLDHWGGLIGIYSYLCGFGIYLYNKNNEQHFILLAILIILIKSIDLKNYAYQLTGYKIFHNNKKIKLNKNTNHHKYGVTSYLMSFKNLFQNFVDERARTIDFICLLIFIDVLYFNIELLNFIYYFIFIKTLILFCGGFYITYFKNFLQKLR